VKAFSYYASVAVKVFLRQTIVQGCSFNSEKRNFLYMAANTCNLYSGVSLLCYNHRLLTTYLTSSFLNIDLGSYLALGVLFQVLFVDPIGTAHNSTHLPVQISSFYKSGLLTLQYCLSISS